MTVTSDAWSLDSNPRVCPQGLGHFAVLKGDAEQGWRREKGTGAVPEAWPEHLLSPQPVAQGT